MNHILLDAQDEAVKRFFLTLPKDAQGFVVELNGQAVACVLRPLRFFFVFMESRKRMFSPFISKMWHRCVKRSSKAAVIRSP